MSGGSGGGGADVGDAVVYGPDLLDAGAGAANAVLDFVGYLLNAVPEAIGGLFDGL